MWGSPRTRAKRAVRSLKTDLSALHTLLVDPVQSRSYFQEAPRKSRPRICGELLWWWLRYREVNRYYYLYGLDRRGASTRDLLPYRRFRALRNDRNFHALGTSGYYNGSYNYICLLRDKHLFCTFANSLGLPVPKLRATLSPEGLQWAGETICRDLSALCEEGAPELDLICKPVDGIMGANIFRMESGPGRLVLSGEDSTIEALRERIGARYILQDRVRQHADLAALHPASVNTLRLVTYLEEGETSLFSASLRVGAGGSSTDNWSAGGILLAVDPNCGCVIGDGFMKPAFGLRVSEHPDSGIVFDGYQVPLYDQALQAASAFHRQLPGVHSIGWDIAITQDGPMILEANDDWDGAIPMAMESGFKSRFLDKYR